MKRKGIWKRMSALALCAAMTAAVLLAQVSAAGTGVTVQLSPQITVVVDGTARTFYNVAGEEVHPISYNGSTYLPLRAIGELMGKNVNWDQSTKTASLSGTRTAANVTGAPDADATARQVSATLSPDITVQVDGITRTFADANGSVVYPLLYGGSIYLPVRAIGNLMGKTVGWNSASSTVTLSSGELLVTDADSFVQTGTATQPAAGKPVQTGSTAQITAEQARSKALAHAGLSASQVYFVQTKLEWEDGRQVYDVEFYTSDYREYDYEIDAASGAVLGFDYDAEHYAPPAGASQSGTCISRDQAISIALAQVPGASRANVRSAKLDRDDGRLEYEIEILYGTLEYEFDINAYTGTIVAKDMESIYD